MDIVDLKNEILAKAKAAGITIFQTFPNTAPVRLPAGTAELSALLDALLPSIVGGVEQARAAWGDGKLSWAEAVALGMTLQGIVSKAVMQGAPLAKGVDAVNLVTLIFGVIFSRYIMPKLPVWLRPFAPLIWNTLAKGLEALYQTVIRKK